MQKVKASHSNRLIQIGFIVFGVVIGVVLGSSFVVLDTAGAFSRASWELVESPIRFKHIADATTRKVWAVTEENKYYCLGFQDAISGLKRKRSLLIRMKNMIIHDKQKHLQVGRDY